MRTARRSGGRNRSRATPEDDLTPPLPHPPGRLRLLLSVALVLLALSPRPLQAQAPDTRAARLVLPGIAHPKDFSLIKRGGTWHLFYIIQSAGAERVIGHSTSPNLYTWTHQPIALAVRDGSWDNESVWAPSIVEQSGIAYMFYTGVHNGPPDWTHEQETGVAISTDPDLNVWNRMEVSDAAPILRCPDFPWTNCASDWPTFRDPFVMRDPRTPSKWLMFLTTRVNTTPGDPNAAPGLLPDWGVSTAVSVARSSGTFDAWGPVQLIDKSHRTWTDPNPVPGGETFGYRTVESPHVFRHHPLWYLFLTCFTEPRILFLTGTDPIGTPETWTLRGFLQNNPPPGFAPFPTSEWSGTEYAQDGDDEYFACYTNASIEIRKIRWGADGDWRFTLEPPYRVDRLTFELPSGVAPTQVTSGDSLRLRVAARTVANRLIDLQVVRFNANGYETVLDASQFGVPATVTPAGDTTLVSFVVRTSDPATVRYRVRSREFPEITTPLIYVNPAPTETPQPVEGPGLPELTFAAGPAPALALRAVRDTPLGQGLALLVEMPSAAPARLDLFDVRGVRVRTLLQRALPQGPTLAPWDLRDAAGASVAPGVYLARLTTAAGRRVARVAVVR